MGGKGDGKGEGEPGSGAVVRESIRKDPKGALGFFEAMLGSASDAIFVIDESLIYTFINKAGGRLIGHDPEEWVGKRSGTAVHPEDKRTADEAVYKAIAGEPSRCEVRVMGSDGSYKCLDLRFTPFFWGDGVYLMGMANDVSENVAQKGRLERQARAHAVDIIKEAEDADDESLESLDQSLEFILGATKTGVDIIDADFNVLYVNSEWKKTYGEYRGKKCYDYFMGAKAPCPTCGIPRALETKEIVVTEETLVKEGNRTIEVHTIPFQNEKGEWLAAEFNIDITERKKAEDALRQSETKFRLLAESTYDWVYWLDRDLHIIYSSPSCERVTGYAPSDFRVDPSLLLNIVHPDDRSLVTEHRRSVRASMDHSELEYRILHRDGSVRWIGHVCKPITGEGGAALGRQSSDRDITERRETEHALRESEEKFRALSEESPNMIFINKGGSVVYANKRCVEVMGYSREEFYAPGFDLMSIIHPDYRKRIRDALARHFKGVEIPPYEYVLVAKDKRRLDALITTKLIDYGGEKAILGIITDITHHMETERALRESEEQYRKLVQTSPDAISVTDLSGRITYVSDSMIRIFGYSRPEDMVGMLGLALMTPEERERGMANISNSLKGGSPKIHVYKLLRRDGSTFYGEVSASVLFDSESSAKGFLVVTRDITERMRAERALRESEEKYRNVVERANDAIVILQDGRVAFANRQIEPMFGYNYLEIVGKPFSEFVPDDVTPDLLERYRLRVEGKGETLASIYESKILKADGTVVPVEINAGVIDYMGKPADLIFIRDLSERKKAEQAIFESELKYRTLFDSAQDAIFLMDGEFFVDCNRKTLEMFQCKRGEIIGQPPYKFSPRLQPDGSGSKEKALRLIDEAFAGKTLFFEWKHTHLDGSEFDTEVSLNLVAFKDKKYVLAIVRDITGRKKSEDLIRKSEKLGRAVIDSSPVGITVRDRGGELLMYNKSWMEIWALSEKTIKERIKHSAGKPFEEIYPHLEPWFREVKVVWTEGGEFFVPEVQIRDMGTGIEKTVSLYFYGILGTDGKLEQIVTLTQDITERKAAEERLNALFQASIDGIGVEKDEKFVFVNPSFAKIFGYDRPEELLDKPMGTIIAPEDRDRVASYTVLRSGGRRAPQRYDFRGLRKDGSTFAARVSVSTYTIGQEWYFVGFVHDVTESRRAETMLRLSEEQYHLTIDSMNDAIHMVDSSLRIMLVNKAFKQWNKRLGLETDTIGKDIFEAFPFLPEKVRYEYEQVFDTGRALMTEESSTIGDAEIITETRKVPVVEGGKVVRVVTIVRDITAQKRRQEEQLRRRMLEAQYELKSVITDIIPLFLETLEPGKREEMIERLSERLDEVIAERYSKAIHLSGAREAATAYIGVLFDLGGTARHESHGPSHTHIRVTACPWENQKHRNFMLCILCRAIAWRFAHYAGEDLAVRMAKTMADGEAECEIQVGTRRALEKGEAPEEEKPKKPGKKTSRKKNG